LEEKIITDMLFSIGFHLYHIECQSKKDGRMILRMFEYDTAIAVEHAEEKDGIMEIRFPESCVVYIKNHTSLKSHHEMNVIFPDGQSIRYKVPILKVQDYTVDDMFQKRLVALLPF
jgi:hypothetical protein